MAIADFIESIGQARPHSISFTIDCTGPDTPVKIEMFYDAPNKLFQSIPGPPMTTSDGHLTKVIPNPYRDNPSDVPGPIARTSTTENPTPPKCLNSSSLQDENTPPTKTNGYAPHSSNIASSADASSTPSRSMANTGRDVDLSDDDNQSQMPAQQNQEVSAL
ncbi:hypothetical protein EJ08DRAFT_658440 [Tothia fuscella]|uniref:Uncharacterized protein n=1 Tax=Tothia fuscella TaxID=1048955 RepID=A0A9P4U1N8_9PEZI|nr:hypothetical protein EJ08DRAFT_658440 [Tothia fuscella]